MLSIPAQQNKVRAWTSSTSSTVELKALYALRVYLVSLTQTTRWMCDHTEVTIANIFSKVNAKVTNHVFILMMVNNLITVRQPWVQIPVLLYRLCNKILGKAFLPTEKQALLHNLSPKEHNTTDSSEVDGSGLTTLRPSWNGGRQTPLSSWRHNSPQTHPTPSNIETTEPHQTAKLWNCSWTVWLQMQTCKAFKFQSIINPVE